MPEPNDTTGATKPEHPWLRTGSPTAESRERGASVAVAPADEPKEGGGSDAPPAAHGGRDLPPPPASWDYPVGIIAGRDNPQRHRPLETPVAPSLGPEGKRRPIWAVIALSVFTLGIYALVWHHSINCEVGDFDTRMHVKAGRSTLAVGVVWFAGLLISAAGAVLIVTTQMHVTLPYRPPETTLEQYLMLGGLLAVPYLVLAIPFALLGMVMTLERVRIVEDRVGRPTDVQLRPVAMVWWLIVPLAGGLILQALVQRRL
ncbi:MAG: DUF4234 domain-containing protein, partial [Candidatus Dormibacteria bacterium]